MLRMCLLLYKNDWKYWLYKIACYESRLGNEQGSHVQYRNFSVAYIPLPMGICVAMIIK